jgi:putative heme-binding domain-containing protein
MRLVLICLFGWFAWYWSVPLLHGQELSSVPEQSAFTAEDLSLDIERKAELFEGLPKHHRFRHKLLLELEKDRKILEQVQKGESNRSLNGKYRIRSSELSNSNPRIALSANDGPPLPYMLKPADLGKPLTIPFCARYAPGTSDLFLAVNGQRIVRRLVVNNQPEDQPVLASEYGLILSFAFSPNFRTDGWIYLFCNPRSGNPPNFNRILRYQLRKKDERYDVAGDPQVILEWESNGHDGGDLLFGTDGYLYIATGDGSKDSDQYLSAQDFTDLRGAVLRIDVSEDAGDKAYRIPDDNPFVDVPGVRGEIFAKGLRNPWRMSMDTKTGAIFLGNSGQDTTESVYRLEKGANYGWSRWEGGRIFQEKRPLGVGKLTFPLIDHDHSESRALTGGIVYRGSKFPELEGWYIYGDYETGKIWAAKFDEGGVSSVKEIVNSFRSILGFLQSAEGDLLVLANNLYKLERIIPEDIQNASEFPKLLSQAGLFESTRNHKVVSSAVGYDVTAPAWNNGATAERFFLLPTGQKAMVTPEGGWECPRDGVVFQTLTLPIGTKSTTHRLRIETRVFIKRDKHWSAYSYLWNGDQSDAYLVEKDGVTVDLLDHFGDRIQSESIVNWQVPSRTQCFACHTVHQNTLLGLNKLQIGSCSEGPDGLHPMERWQKEGLTVNYGKSHKELTAKLVNPYDTSSNIEDRFRSYVHVNCGSCHVSVGGGNSKIRLSFSTPLESTGLIDVLPEHSDFGIPNARIVSPGSPEQSVLFHRMRSDGVGKMPPMGRNEIDKQALELFEQWIQSLPKVQGSSKPWETEELIGLLAREPIVSSLKDLENGRRVFQVAGCAQCHRIGQHGEGFGPDLTSIGQRIDTNDLLRSIVEPSAQIAPSYRTMIFQLSSGETIEGTRVDASDDQYQILQRNGDGRSVILRKDQVESVKESNTSSMPSGLLDRFSASDVADLLAFLNGPNR